jgi:hypothetical protein
MPDSRNVRNHGNPVSSQKAERLHATLAHEFRHLQQERARCNLRGTASSERGNCAAYCYHPDEMNAYLAGIESGYARVILERPRDRIYVNRTLLTQQK